MENKAAPILFLEHRLREVKRRIVNTPDYQEMKVLQRMLKEIMGNVDIPRLAAPLSVLSVPDNVRDPFKKKGGYEKNMDNSPMREMPFGTRISGLYEIVEKLCLENNGQIAIITLCEYLEEVEQNWVKTERDSRDLVLSYIQLHNKKEDADVTLQLMPERPSGRGGRHKYEWVRYVGKQNLVKAGWPQSALTI